MTIVRLSSYRGVVRAQGGGLLYFAEDMRAGLLPEMRAWPGTALQGPETPLEDDGPAGLRYVVIGPQGGFQGMPRVGIPADTSPRRLDLLCRLGPAAIGLFELIGYGAGDSLFGLSLASSSGLLRANVRGGVAMSVSIDLSTYAWHELSLYMDGDGVLSLTIDGVTVRADAAVPLPDDDPVATLRVMHGAPAGVAFAAAGISPSALTPVQASERRHVLAESYRIGGYAALDGGGAADRVLVRRLSDGALIADVTPGDDLTFAVPVPAGDYDVACYGPDTYLPVLVGPIPAQPVAS